MIVMSASHLLTLLTAPEQAREPQQPCIVFKYSSQHLNAHVRETMPMLLAEARCAPQLHTLYNSGVWTNVSIDDVTVTAGMLLCAACPILLPLQEDLTLTVFKQV